MQSDETTATPVAARTLRFVLVVVGLVLWFKTQALIASVGKPPEKIVDRVLLATSSAHGYLETHPRAADLLLVVSSLTIDLLGIFLLAWSIFGPSARPFLGLLVVFILRQLCQACCGLPEPPGAIWHLPFTDLLGERGFPSLLVTYDVASDFFFSGHTAIAVYGAVELARLGRRWVTVLAWGIAVFEMATVLLLRSHWTMDVYAGAVTALLVAMLAATYAPAWDRRLAAIWPR